MFSRMSLVANFPKRQDSPPYHSLRSTSILLLLLSDTSPHILTTNNIYLASNYCPHRYCRDSVESIVQEPFYKFVSKKKRK